MAKEGMVVKCGQWFAGILKITSFHGVFQRLWPVGNQWTIGTMGWNTDSRLLGCLFVNKKFGHCGSTWQPKSTEYELASFHEHAIPNYIELMLFPVASQRIQQPMLALCCTLSL